MTGTEDPKDLFTSHKEVDDGWGNSHTEFGIDEPKIRGAIKKWSKDIDILEGTADNSFYDDCFKEFNSYMRSVFGGKWDVFKNDTCKEGVLHDVVTSFIKANSDVEGRLKDVYETSGDSSEKGAMEAMREKHRDKSRAGSIDFFAEKEGTTDSAIDEKVKNRTNAKLSDTNGEQKDNTRKGNRGNDTKGEDSDSDSRSSQEEEVNSGEGPLSEYSGDDDSSGGISHDEIRGQGTVGEDEEEEEVEVDVTDKKDIGSEKEGDESDDGNKTKIGTDGLDQWADEEGSADSLQPEESTTDKVNRYLRERSASSGQEKIDVSSGSAKDNTSSGDNTIVPLECPKVIEGTNWFDKIAEPDSSTIDEYNELIRLMNRFWRFYNQDLDAKKEDMKRVNEKAAEKTMKDSEDLLKEMSPYVDRYYEPKIDYPNMDPIWKPVESDQDRKMWDYFRHIVSSIPYKPMFGKRQRFFIHDRNSDTELGIMAISSPLLHLAERDEYFGYTQERSKEFEEEYGFNPVEYNPNCICIVPLQPFGYMTGGKLMTQMIASDEIINFWEDEYDYKPWGLHTTSIYGKSTQYDRLYEWDHAGETKGYGAVHYSGISIHKAARYIERYMPDFNHPGTTSADVRLLSEIGKNLDLDVELAYHGMPRGIYACKVMKDFNLEDWYHGNLEINREVHEYPNDKSIKHRHIAPVREKFEFWQDRWFERRWDKYKDDLDDYSIDFYKYEDATQKQLGGC